MRTNNLDYPCNDNQCTTTTETLTVDKNMSIKAFADIILDVSSLLLESGAHCERINRNVQRIAQNSNYKVDMLLSFTAISISVTDKNNSEICITKNKNIKHHSAHFGILTNTSLLTWNLVEDDLSINDLENAIKDLKNMPKYSAWLIRLFIGVACGCLCLLAGGDWLDGAFAFIASAIGLTVRQEMIKNGFNLMISIVCSAFITTTLSGLNILYNLGSFPESSVATAVLFLIPGVPLINSIIDLLEGYIPIGIARGAFGGFILLCIAVGMFLSMTLIGINNF